MIIFHLESSIESDIGMRFAIGNLHMAFHNFAFFKHSFWCTNRLLKIVSYLLIFLIRKNEICLSMIRDTLFFRS